MKVDNMAARCEQCNTIIDGYNGKMVMIEENLWLSIANKKDVLCDDCIEVKLGRKIGSKDLKYHFSTKIPVNQLYAKINGIEY